MRHLLVPLDGSGFGETALALAAAIAERKGCALDIVTVHAPTAHPDLSAPMSSEIETWFRTRAQEYLDCMAEQVRRRFSIELRTTVLQGGAATAIAEHALANPPELIVMCTHARSGPSRLFLGSVADRLVRELHCPSRRTTVGYLESEGERSLSRRRPTDRRSRSRQSVRKRARDRPIIGTYPSGSGKRQTIWRSDSARRR